MFNFKTFPDIYHILRIRRVFYLSQRMTLKVLWGEYFRFLKNCLGIRQKYFSVPGEYA
jgi:hypothetical protein